jgi:glutaredoxin 3
MTSKLKVEIFTAGCQLCHDAVALVTKVANGKSDVTVHKMQDIATATRAKALGITSIPAIVIDGKLAACCSGRGIDEAVLRIAGLGA